MNFKGKNIGNYKEPSIDNHQDWQIISEISPTEPSSSTRSFSFLTNKIVFYIRKNRSSILLKFKISFIHTNINSLNYHCFKYLSFYFRHKRIPLRINTSLQSKYAHKMKTLDCYLQNRQLLIVFILSFNRSYLSQLI